MKNLKKFEEYSDDEVNERLGRLISKYGPVISGVIRRGIKKFKDYFTKPKPIIKSKPTIKPKSVYTKSASDRTIPYRYGKSYSNIDDEFYALKKMNQIDPNFIKPIDLVSGKSYTMEKFDGQELSKYIENGGVVSETIKRGIRNAIIKIHEGGLVHGDLKTNNILISKDGKTFKIIDPVGFPLKGFKDFEKAKADEISNLNNLF